MLAREFVCLKASLFAFLLCSSATAQEQAGNPLQVLLRANDRFGVRLLAQAHSEAPDKNLVLAPLPLTILLGAIHTSSRRQEASQEFDRVFGWGEYPDIRIPTRMMLAAMDKPRPDGRKNAIPDFVEPGTLWMENRLLYRSPKNSLPLLDERFVESASRDFGLKLVNTGDKNPEASDLRKSREQVGALPQVSPLDQVWLSSGMHMRQTWEKLFMESQPAPGKFHLESGETRTVLKVESEQERFPHVKNDKLEAVELPCGRVAMIVVLPAPGTKIQALEQYLAGHPDALENLSTSRYGSVTFPQFEIKTAAHLETSLKGMGITDIFEHLDGVTRMEQYPQSQRSIRWDGPRGGVEGY
jgi:hypothetical protein